MKNNLKRSVVNRSGGLTTVTVLITLLIIFFLSGTAGAQDNRSFFFPTVFIEAEILPDGSMKVVEERTFRFDGRYRGAWLYIPLKYNTAITDVVVSEEGNLYRQMPAGTQDIPGIYYVDTIGDEVVIDWSFEASNEDRTFTISYLVTNAVQVHNDLAEIYWQFIGDEWDQRTESAVVTLYLPGETASDQVKVWGHGPLHGYVGLIDSTTVRWEVEDLSPGTFLEGRVAFPKELVPGSDNFTGRDGLPDMLKDEERWARQANLKRTVTRIDFFLGPVILLGMLGWLITAVIKSRRHPDAYNGDYYRELPAEYSPSEAGYLVRKGRTGPEDFTATVMDLARRGHLRLEEYSATRGRLIKREFTDYKVIPAEGKDVLKKHEQLLYSFIFEKVGAFKSEGTTLQAIEQFGKRSKEETYKFYKSWTESIKESADKHKFFLGTYWPGIIAGIILTVIGIPFIMLDILITGMIAVIAGPLFLVGFTMLKRFTALGADHYAKWEAFKKFLQHFSRLDQSTIPSLVIWEHYLVYAIVLNVAKEVMEQLKLVYPDLSDNKYVAWPAYGSIAANPSRFNTVTSSMEQSFKNAFKSASSSGSGGGGGFSGGGGGGGGGGAR